jgi:hypothetical protein
LRGFFERFDCLAGSAAPMLLRSLGVRVGFHRFEHDLMVIQGGVIDPDITYFGEGDDRNEGPQLGFQGIVGVRHRCEQDGARCASGEAPLAGALI